MKTTKLPRLKEHREESSINGKDASELLRDRVELLASETQRPLYWSAVVEADVKPPILSLKTSFVPGTPSTKPERSRPEATSVQVAGISAGRQPSPLLSLQRSPRHHQNER